MPLFSSLGFTISAYASFFRYSSNTGTTNKDLYLYDASGTRVYVAPPMAAALA
jgi:hypothetical protein